MSEILNLRKFVAPEIIFGSGARKLAGNYASRFSARKVLIVTDSGVIAAGWLKEVAETLAEENIPFHVFSAVSANPRSGEVMRGAREYREQNCNLIISVGGGSPMDCAKGIGIVVSNDSHILDFEGVDKIDFPVPPLIFIPTTAGTSADVSQFAIINNEEERVKIAIISKSVVPDVALIDPDTTYTMDSYLTACTGIDALVHAFEAYVSTGSGVLTDMYALEAIRLINKDLPPLMNDSQNSRLRESIMLASMKAGLAFSNAILGAVHAMAHSLGGYLDMPHGECNAMLLEHVVNFNYSAAASRYRHIAEAMDIRTEGLSDKIVQKELTERIVNLKKEVGIVDTLKTRGVSDSDIPVLAEKAAKDPCLITNPRNADSSELAAIYREAM
ncbi:alcohol dehydrogenase-like regulatory protein ErcA [Spirochaeta isovalerica]|uniref:Alcohol dehydrogenase class IV n=1 Tax=Spirochaeta isovalerica TaxID=150 RepID=A0A841R9I6_9SPIO|nr:alcohol dehydrogenase-like regulatory protein ErcA [Spirochaeta isovalerica]MBB6480563.1 alcohol dehydrogenase class IV [Spirochaeta isovalerica]